MKLQSPIKQVFRILEILPPLIWAGLIFYLSAQPNLNSGLGAWDLILRKIAHMAVFAILFWLIWRAFAFKRQYFLWSLLIAILYAASDEWHQSFIVGRSMEFIDFLFDSLGILAVALGKLKSEAPLR